jgi:hypothetical protein
LHALVTASLHADGQRGYSPIATEPQATFLIDVWRAFLACPKRCDTAAKLLIVNMIGYVDYLTLTIGSAVFDSRHFDEIKIDIQRGLLPQFCRNDK